MRGFADAPQLQAAKEAVTAQEHYDSSREPREFKGFYLWEV